MKGLLAAQIILLAIIHMSDAAKQAMGPLRGRRIEAKVEIQRQRKLKILRKEELAEIPGPRQVNTKQHEAKAKRTKTRGANKTGVRGKKGRNNDDGSRDDDGDDDSSGDGDGGDDDDNSSSSSSRKSGRGGSKKEKRSKGSRDDDDGSKDDDDDDDDDYSSSSGESGKGGSKKGKSSKGSRDYDDVFYPSVDDIAFFDDAFFDDHFFDNDDCELVTFDEKFAIPGPSFFLAPDTTVNHPGSPELPGTVVFFEGDNILHIDGDADIDDVTVSGSCTRTTVGVHGGGVCQLVFVSEEDYSITVNGYLQGPLGSQLVVTGGTGGMVGVIGQMDFFPVYDDSSSGDSADLDIFLDPIRYEVIADMGLVVCP